MVFGSPAGNPIEGIAVFHSPFASLTWSTGGVRTTPAWLAARFEDESS